MVINVPKFVHDEIPDLAEWEEGDEPTFVLALDADDAWDYVENMNTHGHYEQADPNAATQEDIQAIGGLTFIIARTTHGEIGYGLPGVVPDPPEDAVETLVRFAGVFDLAYKRFEDLQKAEAQAREAQVELSLERIRAQATAMQESSDLLDIVVTMHAEFTRLGHQAHYFWHMRWLPDTYEKAMTSGDGTKIGMVMTLPRHIHGDIEPVAEWEKSDEPTYVLAMEPDMAVDYVDKMISLGDFERVDPQAPSLDDIRAIGGLTFIMARTTHGEIGFSLPGVVPDPPEDAVETLVRFAGVFDLAYKRFEDLKAAERQHREAQVELALEKVRSRSLAMHKSDELNEVVKVLFEELQLLQIPSTAVAIQTFTEESKDMQVFVCGDVGTGLVVNQYLLPYFDHPIIHDYLEAHEKKLDFYVGNYSKKEKDRFYERILKLPELQDIPKEVKQMINESTKYTVTMVPAEKSLLGVNDFQGNQLSESQVDILKRFAKVFDQAYIRFLDLEKAEERARQAQIEASLERVRAKAMSMQNSDELDEVLSVLCEQFDVLGILPMSTHMTVFDFENNTFTFRETGKYGDRSFGEQTVDLDAMDNWKETVDKWKADKASDINRLHFPKEQLPEVWEVFHESFASMPEKSRITPNDYPDGIYHTAGKHPFGYIGMNQIRPATEEEEEIVIKFAHEFGRAYQRFLDLKKAEEQALLIREERDRLEIALNELNAAKDQLVQQEKLASLGQLTAGIAHEIKNPLNFVNNFSEVSVELIEEVREEISAFSKKLSESPLSGGESDGEARARGGSDGERNEEENRNMGQESSTENPPMSSEVQPTKPLRRSMPSAQADLNPLQGGEDIDYTLSILSDIEANLRKIHEHGSRADRIVKSMLQHSRGGDGKMEQEAINPLIKEYVNLAFHGMRAGKDPINVDIELELDEQAGEVPLIAEDFSRVILNLCNNAFDAMRGKQDAGDRMQDAEKYVPKLTIRTFLQSGTLTIEIEDNGEGIPDHIKDKILQPFFTTKKGTAGTGLGLSITNDIIKAHGGQMDIQSKQGQTVFTIKLTI
jgi:signal transduction histidine kinase